MSYDTARHRRLSEVMVIGKDQLCNKIFEMREKRPHINKVANNYYYCQATFK
jgi:hypothetical protein